jgi:signal transduction histidine kinase
LQSSVILIAVLHLFADIRLDNSLAFPEGIPVALLIVPVGYAALRYGLSGSAATAVWASVLWLPDLFLPRDIGHSASDIIALLLVDGVGFFVGQRVEAERIASARVESAAVELMAAEERYRQLFHANSAPIFVVDKSGIVIDANLACRTSFGADIIGQNGTEVFGINIVSESLSDQVISMKDGHDYRVNSVRLATGSGDIEAQVVLEDITRERIEGRRIRHYAELVVRAEEEQRLQLSRELHDEPLQIMMHLARRLEMLAERRDIPSDFGEMLLELRQHVLDTAGGLRAIAIGLRPPALDQLGLVPALRSLFADLEDQTGLMVSVEIRGTAVRLASEVELGAFRIVQESASNVAKHADAGTLAVLVNFDAEFLRLEISDNGHGFEFERLEEHTGEHLGVIGMRERARSLGGNFEMRSSIDGGTLVSVSIPIDKSSVRDEFLARDHPTDEWNRSEQEI